MERVECELRLHDPVMIWVRCGSGVHRSVAIAEAISKELQGKGIRTVVKHVHWRQRPGDQG